MSVVIPASEQEAVFEGLFAAKVYVEDMLALERAGNPTAFKFGALQKDLNAINRAITVLEATT